MKKKVRRCTIKIKKTSISFLCLDRKLSCYPTPDLQTDKADYRYSNRLHAKCHLGVHLKSHELVTQNLLRTHEEK